MSIDYRVLTLSHFGMAQGLFFNELICPMIIFNYFTHLMAVTAIFDAPIQLIFFIRHRKIKHLLIVKNKLSTFLFGCGKLLHNLTIGCVKKKKKSRKLPVDYGKKFLKFLSFINCTGEKKKVESKGGKIQKFVDRKIPPPPRKNL